MHEIFFYQSYSNTKFQLVKRLLCLSMLLIIVLFCIPANAVKIEATLENSVVASAEYVPGDPSRPAVLVLHGFLATHNFFTVVRLAEYLADDGFSVLSPTLSLGISNRKNSLSCDAVHTHNMQDDLKEIVFWIDWLVNKGHKDIYLVGHSYGSLQLLIYQSTYKHSAVRRVIATSLVDIEHTVGLKASQSQIDIAKDMIAQQESSLGNFQFSFCNKYVSPPQAYLSYAKWSKGQIVSLFENLSTPSIVIMGSKDSRMDKNWPDMLRQSKVDVMMIEGANHFFDAQFEFDLVDAVLSIMHVN